MREAQLEDVSEIQLALRREDLYDRRWRRHRDQFLTTVGVASLMAALAFNMPVLSVAAALSAGPRAATWLLGLVAMRGDSTRAELDRPS